MKVFHLEVMSCDSRFHRGREVRYGGTYFSRKKAEKASEAVQLCDKCRGRPFYLPHCTANVVDVEVDREPGAIFIDEE